MTSPALPFDNGQLDAQGRVHRATAGIFPYKFPYFPSHRSLFITQTDVCLETMYYSQYPLARQNYQFC